MPAYISPVDLDLSCCVTRYPLQYINLVSYCDLIVNRKVVVCGSETGASAAIHASLRCFGLLLMGCWDIFEATLELDSQYAQDLSYVIWNYVFSIIFFFSFPAFNFL